MSEASATDGSKLLANVLMSFVCDLSDRGALCAKHEADAAIHDSRSGQLEIYRMFERSESITNHMRLALRELPYWDDSGVSKDELRRLEKVSRDIEARMKKHKRLLPIITQSATWEGRPFLVHAYKFETDPIMKVELIVPKLGREDADLPIYQVSDALGFHEYLVPELLAPAQPPYKHHEAKFTTISDYLIQKMPKGMYATDASHIAVETLLNGA